MSEGFERALRRELMGVARARRHRCAGWLYLLAFVVLVAAALLGLGETLAGRVALLLAAVGLGVAYSARLGRQMLAEISDITAPPEL